MPGTVATLSFDVPLTSALTPVGPNWYRADGVSYDAGPNEVAMIQVAVSFQTQTDAAGHIMNLAALVYDNGAYSNHSQTYAAIDPVTRIGHLSTVARVPLTAGHPYWFGIALQDGIQLAIGGGHGIVTIVRE